MHEANIEMSVLRVSGCSEKSMDFGVKENKFSLIIHVTIR